MSSGWAIYTKLDVAEMVELFRPLPVQYPGVFGFYGTNKILTPSQNQIDNCAHYICDPRKVYTENTAAEEYLYGFYEEDYGFKPVSYITIERCSLNDIYNGVAFLYFIQNFLSGIDHFLIHTSAGCPQMKYQIIMSHHRPIV